MWGHPIYHFRLQFFPAISLGVFWLWDSQLRWLKPKRECIISHNWNPTVGFSYSWIQVPKWWCQGSFSFAWLYVVFTLKESHSRSLSFSYSPQDDKAAPSSSKLWFSQFSNHGGKREPLVQGPHWSRMGLVPTPLADWEPQGRSSSLPKKWSLIAKEGGTHIIIKGNSLLPNINNLRAEAFICFFTVGSLVPWTVLGTQWIFNKCLMDA